MPANFVDASSLLTTPCEARTARVGSLVIEGRRSEALDLDAPLSAELLSLDPAQSLPDPRCGIMEEDQ